MTRAVVELSLRCDNACRFCAQAGRADAGTDPDAIRAALDRLRRDHAEVTFVGGEPTLVPELPDLVAHARALGFSAVGVQTNGWTLTDPDRRAPLVAAGLTDVHLSIHGASARAHDYHTDRPGSFAHAMQLASTLGDLGVTVVASSVVTRSSYRDLAGLPALLVAHAIAAWTVWWPVVAGRAADDFDRIVPRLGMATPFVLRAIDAANRVGLPTALAGFPACVLGPFAAQRLPTPAFGFAEVCDACQVRDDCCGIDPSYALRFSTDELRPPPSQPDPHGLPSALARMFVGPGSLATRSPPPRAPSPSRARAALPILGRPEPARAEVRGRARRTGRDLETLFPALFEPSDDEP